MPASAESNADDHASPGASKTASAATPAPTTALKPSLSVARPLSDAEQGALQQAAGDSSLVVSLSTGTRVDVGRWGRRARVCIGGTDDGRVVIAAAGPSPLIWSENRSAMRETMYNHVAGMLVLAGTGAGEPLDRLGRLSGVGDDGPPTALRMSPTDARTMLNWMDSREPEHA